MRAKLSVVIPTLNAGAGLKDTLLALTEGLQAGMIRELIISDGGSTDETLTVADAAGAVVVRGPASRGGQLRRGADVAAGEWLLFLHADTCPPAGWTDCVAAQMGKGGPAVFRLRFDRKGFAARWVAGWANLRTRWLHLPYGDQGLLISRVVYDAVGGFDDFPLMEDVAMARKLAGRVQVMPMAVTTSAARYQRDGWARRGGRNIFMLIRYLLGADPEKLIEKY